MKKIKILHIIKSLGRGGAEVLLPETLKLHDPAKFQFHYLYFLPWKDQMVASIEKAGGEVKCFPAKNNFQLLLQYQKVMKYCRKNEIDLIHCHLPWSGFLGRMIFKKTGIPVIYTEHNIQERYHLVTKMLNKQTFNSQSLALGVSEDVSRSIKENINPEIPVQTLLNGVNTDHFQRDREKGKIIRGNYKIPEDSVVLGNIAVFREQKNIPDWIRAFKEINQRHPETYGVLVGAGVKEPEIRNLIDKLDLKEKVILPGMQTETISFFSAMDIFMMSSDFEGLPIALLEAMSMECAIVSTRAGGVVEAVRDGKDGLLVPVGNYKDLARAAEELVGNPEKMKLYKSAARSRVVDAFSMDSMVKELESIYIKVKNDHKKSR